MEYWSNMLKKMVDGIEQICSDAEEKLIKDFWALNEKYPEYVGHCAFDGVNSSYHDMVECRKHHKHLIAKAHDMAKEDLNKRIEIAQEEGNDLMYKSLLPQRKELRMHLSKEFDVCKTVDDLRSSIPEALKPYWNK
jgi:hypothetical protein